MILQASSKHQLNERLWNGYKSICEVMGQEEIRLITKSFPFHFIEPRTTPASSKMSHIEIFNNVVNYALKFSGTQTRMANDYL